MSSPLPLRLHLCPRGVIAPTTCETRGDRFQASISAFLACLCACACIGFGAVQISNRSLLAKLLVSDSDTSFTKTPWFQKRMERLTGMYCGQAEFGGAQVQLLTGKVVCSSAHVRGKPGKPRRRRAIRSLTRSIKHSSGSGTAIEPTGSRGRSRRLRNSPYYSRAAANSGRRLRNSPKLRTLAKPAKTCGSK